MPEPKIETIHIHEFTSDLIPPTSETMNNPKQGGAKITVIGKAGCFAKGTNVMKFDGSIVPIENIKEGDLVMGNDSTPRKVLELCRGREKMYIINHDRGSTTVNENHILSLKHLYSESVLNIKLSDFLSKEREYGASDNYYGQNPSVGYYKNFRWYYNKPNVQQWWILSFIFSFIFPPSILSKFSIMGLEEDDYYGFTLDGNHLFLLEDHSVVHNTGKTTLIDRLLYEKKHIIPTGWVMSGTEDSNGHFKEFMESLFVFTKLQVDRISSSIRRQRIAINYTKCPWAVWIADDCTDDPKIFNKPLFQGLYKNGRHWKMMWILSVQYVMDSKIYMRTNTDGTFIGRESNMDNRKKLWKQYAGCVPTFDLFNALMDELTSDFSWIFVRNNYPSNKLEELVFYWQPPPCPKGWKFGCREYHEFASARYNPEYQEPLY